MADNDKQYMSFMDVENDTDELLGFNPEADANAMLPPIPAGKYNVLVTFESADPEKRWQQGVWAEKKPSEQKVLYTNLVVKIFGTDGDSENRTVRDMVSTFVSRGTCSVQGVLQALGYQEQLKSCKTRGQLAQLLTEALSGDNAVAEVEIEWEATEKLNDEERDALKKAGKREWRVQGMARYFKQGEDGNYIPEIEHNGAMCRAYNIVSRWITKGDEAVAASAAASAPTQQAPPPARAAAPQAQQAPPQRPAQSGPPVPASARRVPPAVPAGKR